MSHRKQVFLLAIFAPAFFDPALAGELPSRVGECVTTAIKSVGTRGDNAKANIKLSGFFRVTVPLIHNDARPLECEQVFKKVDRLFRFWHDPSCPAPRAKFQIQGYDLP